jgi:hypothetical protein
VTATYQDLVEAYLAQPGPAALGALREAVRTAPGFDPASGIDEHTRSLIAAEDWAGVVAALRGRMPGAIFSPSAHAELSHALGRLGRAAEAAREAELAQSALRSILATGSGTADEPWSVLRISDEYDVVSATGTRAVGQALVTVAGRQVDQITCDDGSVRCFDVTPLVGARG